MGVRDASEPATPLSNPGARVPSMSFLEWMMTVDLVTFLPDYILTKVDRATMAASLSALPHRWNEFRGQLCDEDPMRLVLHAIAIGWAAKWRS